MNPGEFDQNAMRVFSLEEANQLLPQLTLWICELQEKRKAILDLELEIDTLELISEKDSEGISPSVSRKVEDYQDKVDRFYDLLEELHSSGCHLKDLDMGLLDFYSHVGGRPVFLCWKLGEPKVAHWHEIGQGYASRHPL